MKIVEINQYLKDLPEPKKKEKWVEVRDEMIVHTRGATPGDILLKRRPNEDPEVQKYRLEIYEPITKGSMNRAIDKLFRIFQSANFSIKVSGQLSEYLDKQKFSNQYFYSYIQKFVVRRMIEDPNGFLAWIPSGPGVEDSTKKVDVTPVLIESGKVRFLTEDSITWLDPDQKSMIRKNGKLVEEGDVYFTLTTTGFFRHNQEGDTIKKRFVLVPIYEHNMNQVPAMVLGGDQTDDGYFESYFSSFLPFANEAIRQYSDWQGVMTTTCFPYREEVAETCSAPGCRDGYCYDAKKDENFPCKECKGMGRIIVRSPFGVFLREKGGGVLDPQGGSGGDVPMLRFISPPVDVIRESREAWELLLDKAERALCLDNVEEAQSGVAKKIDREDGDMVLTKVSNNVFDEIIFKSLLFIEKYRNVTDPMDPIIVKPISFSSKTEDDLIDELNKLTDKNAPISFLVEATKDLAKKRFSSNKAIARMVEILVSYDPIYHVTKKDQQLMLASGIIKKDVLIRSVYAYKALMTLVSKNGSEYLEKEMETIFMDLDKAIQPEVDKIMNQPLVSLGGTPAGGGGNGEFVDEELKAKANLKGSVGGVQGIIAIQQSVARGFTSRNAAVELLMEIYGFSREVSEKMIGDPIDAPVE